jgi:uncharacterized membrane protein
MHSTASKSSPQGLWGRWLRHRWLDDTDVERAFGEDSLARIEERIGQAEGRHRGEIRVCVEAGLPLSALWHRVSARSRAESLFGKLGVWNTQHRSGVLIYVLLAERAVELIADRGVNARIEPGTWQGIVDRLTAALRAGDGGDGLVSAVAEVGALLEQHFPLEAGQSNPNELSNRVDRR